MSGQDMLEAQLGEDAKSFLETDLGRLFTTRADSDEQGAIQALVQLDPFEYETLADLQNAIASAQRDMEIGQRIAQYLRDAIVNGELAWQQLEANEEV